MLEILFIGKRVDNGEWVEGNYIQKIRPDRKEPTFWCCFIQDMALSRYEVLPETVGQFTGFIDKNGKKIFNGAIVKNGDYTYFIKFCNGAYYAFHCRVKDAEGEPYRWGLISRFEELNIEIEIIGNIHDNPELLK